MRPPKFLIWLLLLWSVVGATGAVVSSGGRYPSPWVDDWSDTPLIGTSNTCNAAMAACAAATGRVQFKAGTYKISLTSATALPDNCVVSGQGMGVTILSAVAGETGAALAAGSDNTFTDLSLVGNDEATTTGLSITNGKHRVTCTRVEFKDFSTGASGGNGVVNGLVYRDCKWTSNVTGLGVGVASTGVMVDGGVCNGNTTNGISLHGNPVGGSVTGVTFVNEPTCLALASSTGIVASGNAFLAGTTSISFSTPVRCEIGDNYWAFDEITPSDCLNKQISLRGKYYGNATPASGTWVPGDIVWDYGNATNPQLGWVCSTGGTPGTWQNAWRGPRVVTTTINPAANLASGAHEKFSITTTGLVLGQTCTVQSAENLPDGFFYWAQVTSTTNIDVMLFNVGGSGTNDVASGTVTVHLFQ